MSLFQCENCGCKENTAVSLQGDAGMDWMQDEFKWDGIEDRIGKRLCSVCSPEFFTDGTGTGLGKWHGKFERIFLDMGMYYTDGNGNLKRKD